MSRHSQQSTMTVSTDLLIGLLPPYIYPVTLCHVTHFIHPTLTSILKTAWRLYSRINRRTAYYQEGSRVIFHVTYSFFMSRSCTDPAYKHVARNASRPNGCPFRAEKIEKDANAPLTLPNLFCIWLHSRSRQRYYTLHKCNTSCFSYNMTKR